MSKGKINGFLIVRKSLKDSVPYHDIHRVGNKEYRGIERLHLEDIISDYYEKKLPRDISQIVSLEDKGSIIWPFFHYISDYTNAIKVLEYINKLNDLNELIVISWDGFPEAQDQIRYPDTSRTLRNAEKKGL